MRKIDIEGWALKIIDQVLAGQSTEDSRVELKAKWPDPQKAARRIAAHANTAGGEPILWLIGVDEKGKSVIGASNLDKAEWYPAVESCFVELSPDMRDLNIPSNGTTVTALLFDTDRAPFVIKNPAYGKSPDSVEYEVPWRSATGTRSAKRSDLIRLLLPIEAQPEIEVLNGSLHVNIDGKEGPLPTNQLIWKLSLDLYFAPRNRDRIVIPFHKCEASFEVRGIIPLTPFSFFSIGPQVTFSPETRSLDSLSATMTKTNAELIVDGPGEIRLIASTTTEFFEGCLDSDIRLVINFSAINSDRPVVIDRKFSPSGDNKWELSLEGDKQ